MEGFWYTQDVAGAIDFTTTGDKGEVTPSQPIDVIGFGVIATALIDVGAGMVVKMDWRPTAGSDTSRTDGVPTSTTAPGNLTTPQNLSTSTTDIAAGTGAYVLFDEPIQVDPGEQLVFQVTDAADTAGTGVLFIMYQPRPFVPEWSRMDNMTDLTP